MATLTAEEQTNIERKYSTYLNGIAEYKRPDAIRALAMGEALGNAVNGFGFDNEAFGLALASNHRTLVQSSMRAFMGFCKKLAEFDAEGYHDGRNQASCELATQIMNLNPRLPNV